MRFVHRQLMPQDRAPSREKGQPLCMAQYQRLFTSYRVPGLERDHLKSMPTSDEAEHIIVAYNGQVNSSMRTLCSSSSFTPCFSCPLFHSSSVVHGFKPQSIMIILPACCCHSCRLYSSGRTCTDARVSLFTHLYARSPFPRIQSTHRDTHKRRMGSIVIY